MVPTSRRHLLSGVAATLAALAGCSGSSSRSQSVPRRRRPENVETNPESYSLRYDGGRDGAPVWLVRDDETPRESAETPPENARNRGLVATEQMASRMRVADVEGAEAAREFVAGTNFEEETLYLETNPVRACYRLELCYVTWTASDIETQYGSYPREADTACRVDVRHSVSMLIRIPDTLDPDAVTSHGSGWSSGGCHAPPWRRDERERRRTPRQAGPLPPANETTATGDDE